MIKVIFCTKCNKDTAHHVDRDVSVGYFKRCVLCSYMVWLNHTPTPLDLPEGTRMPRENKVDNPSAYANLGN